MLAFYCRGIYMFLIKVVTSMQKGLAMSDRTNAKPRALIIDGATLLLAMGEADESKTADTHAGAGAGTEETKNADRNSRNNRSGFSSNNSAASNNANNSPTRKRSPSLHPADMSTESLLLKLANQCKAVVACRVSPDQKRELVAMVKHGTPGIRTLSIGDGANDVAMIQEAHIGVGIRGEEGLQAVNAADYGIAQFRYLSPLLLKHGRYNFINMSKLVCYMFYKNILMSLGQFWFNFNNGFSGQKYYTEGTIQLFNLVYSAFPILLLGIYDKDIEPEFLYRYPQLYKSVSGERFFNVSATDTADLRVNLTLRLLQTKLFWSWIVTAILESIVCSVLPLYLLTNSDPTFGDFSSFWQAGALCLTVVVIVVNIKVSSSAICPHVQKDDCACAGRYCSYKRNGIGLRTSLLDSPFSSGMSRR
jgi:hypothetical protein